MDKTVLVTGASSGIGRALAFEFASRGFDLILVARREGQLKTTASEISKAHRRKAEIFAGDLRNPATVDSLLSEIAVQEISILVNNAGVGVHGEFSTTALTEELKLIELQLSATLRLTKAVLPGMIARRQGRILNVASVYAYTPVPNQAVYAACKSFLFSFSHALAAEVREHGITVTAACPGSTATEFHTRSGIEGRKGKGASSESVARYLAQACLKGKAVAVPGLFNRVFVSIASLLPYRVLSPVMRKINSIRGVNQSGAHPTLS